MRQFALFVGLFLASLSAACHHAPPPASTQELLERMKQAYAACQSYQDVSELMSISSMTPAEAGLPNPPTLTNTVPFRIQFQRPWSIHYESTHREMPATVTPDEIRNIANWPRYKWDYYFDGQQTVYYAGTTRRYWRAASLVPGKPQAMPSFPEHSSPILNFLTTTNAALTGMQFASPILGENTFDGTACYVVSAILQTNMIAIEAWIGKNDYLLRKIRLIYHRKGSTDGIVDENHREIHLNQKIAASVFTPSLPSDALEVTNLFGFFPDLERNRMAMRQAALAAASSRKVVNFGAWTNGNTIASISKEPRYIDCYPDKVILYPHSITNTWEDLQRPDNPLEQMLAIMNSTNESIVIMARPESVKFFRAARKLVRNHPQIEVSYDAVDANFRVNWEEARQALGNPLPQPTPPPPQPLRAPRDQSGSMIPVFKPIPRAKSTSKQPLFFECRGGEVFFIDKVGLDDQVAKVLAALSPDVRSGDIKKFLAAFSDKVISNEYYKIVPSYLLTAIIALEPKPGVHGDNVNQLTEANRVFQSALDKYDRQNFYTVFMVRSDSFEAFRQARAAAAKREFETGWELLGDDEPIKFGTGGNSVDTR